MWCISSLGIGRVQSQLGVSLTRFSLWGTFSTTLQSQVYEWCMYKIKYESLDNGAARNEFICTHEKFHGWKCEEAMIFSTSDTIWFAKIIKMFGICVQGSISSIALAQEYCLVLPSEYIENAWIIGFPLLQLKPPQHTFFVPVVKFIRRAFIVPTTDHHRSNFYLLNDVIDTDMFFRLQTLVQDRLGWEFNLCIWVVVVICVQCGNQDLTSKYNICSQWTIPRPRLMISNSKSYWAYLVCNTS